MDYQTILLEKRGVVALVTLNRPKALNALNSEVLAELTHVLDALDADDGVGAIVITGSQKAFAAGADIKQMQPLTYPETYLGDFFSGWERVSRQRKPTIAAVCGYALGGGCELAMMCDIIIASESARFGQPEVTIGIMPGMGGTQRFTRAVGKAKAMEMVLTGRQMDAAEALQCGLVARVVADDGLVEDAVATAAKICSYSRPAVMMAKEAVNRAFEVPLEEGLRFERRMFHSLFATDDQKEGMSAFVEKRPPAFRNR
jgi:enoyl-CoA hydratase